MAGLFIGNQTFKRCSSQLAFLVTGIILALIGNYLRSLYLAITAHRNGIEELERMHAAAGWGIFAFYGDWRGINRLVG